VKKILVLGLLMLLIIPAVSAAWWDASYDYKVPINCTSLSDGTPIIINGSEGFTVGGETQYIWTYCRGDATHLYYNNYSSYAVANDTTQLPMEVEQGNGTSYNPTLVWDDYEGVYHFGSTSGVLVDSTGNEHNLTSGAITPTYGAGYIAGAYTYAGGVNEYFIVNSFGTGSATDYVYSAWATQDANLNDYSAILVGSNYGLVTSTNDYYRFIQATDTAKLGDGYVFGRQTAGASNLYFNNTFRKTSGDENFDPPKYLGNDEGNAGREWKGMIDEVRFTNDTSLSLLVLNESYYNVLSYEGYGDVGAEEVGSLHPTMTTPAWNETDAYEYSPINLTSTYKDSEGDAGTVYWNCSVNGTSVVDSTILAVANNTITSMYFDNSYFGGNDLINCSVYANDGSSDSSINWSSTLTVVAAAVSSYWNNASTPALEGDLVHYMLEVNESGWIDVNATLYINGTGYFVEGDNSTGNWTMSVDVPMDMIGGTNSSYYWDLDLGSAAYTTSENTPTYQTEVLSWFVGACTAIMDTQCFEFHVYDEEYLIEMENASVIGTLNCWIYNSSYSNNFTFNLEDSNSTTLGNTVKTLSSCSGSANYVSSTTFEFEVYQPSIITNINPLFQGTNCTGIINYSIRKGGDVLAYKEVTSVSELSLSNKEANFTVNNYTSTLTPGNFYDFHINSVNTSADCKFAIDDGTCSSGSIIIYKFQGEYPLRNNVTWNSVALSNSFLCLSPGYFNGYCDGSITNEDAYLHRWYLLNASISNVSSEVSMFNFNETDDKVTATTNLLDENYYSLADYYIKLMRFYPGENLWRLVQMDKTDIYGATYFHVYEETKDYKYIIQDYTTVLETTGTVKFYEPYGADLVYNIKIDTGASSFAVYSGYNYTYDSTTKMFTLDWNDVSGLTTKILLQSWSGATSGRVLWCNTSLSANAGTLFCNLSSSSGSVYVSAYRTTTDSAPIFQYLIDGAVHDLYDSLLASGMEDDGLFYAGIIATVIILAGAFYPLSLLISIPVAITFIMLLGIVNWITLTVLIASIIFTLFVGVLAKQK